MTKLSFLAFLFAVSISVSAQTSAQTNRDDVLQLARAVNTAELDLFMTSGHVYAPLEKALKDAQKMNPGMGQITPIDSVSGSSGNYIISIVISPDEKHYRLSIIPKTNDCSWSLFSDERGVIYFGKAIDCFQGS